MKAKAFRVAAALMIIAASLAAAVLPAGVATAAAINVPGDFPTIAQAVAAANPAGGDTIVVAPGTYNEFDITIDKSLTIQGAGQGTTIVDALMSGRVFYISGAGTTVAMSGLTIQDGAISDQDDAFGGGILNEGTLTLTNCAVTNNNVSSGAADAYGAGIANSGTLTLTNCQVLSNLAFAQAEYAWGGGIASGSTLVLTGCAVSSNWAVGYLGASGGGIDNAGTASLTDCFIGDNMAYTAGEGYGGGLANWSGWLTLSNCTVHRNLAYSEYWFTDGGGIENHEGILTMYSSTLSYNIADGWEFGSGGGIENEDSTVALTNCTLSGNQAWGLDSNSGGIDNWDTFGPLHGRAPGDTGTAPDPGTVQRRSEGMLGMTPPAGIEFPPDWGSPPSSAELLANSMAAIRAPAAGLQQPGISATLINCTVTDNLADYYKGGEAARAGGIWNNATLALRCTIVYGNTATDGPGDVLNIGQAPYTKVHSIVGDPNGDPDPLLGPLQDNGGPTWTHALLPGSPAINRCFICSVAKDQRGEPRAQGGLCDIGAYELEQRPPTVPALSLWGTAGLAVVLAGLVAWSLRRRLVSRKDVN